MGESPRFDLVVRGGTVVTARTVVQADIGIAAGRIAAVGVIAAHRGGDEVDAKGMLVLPGGVDAHTHLDWQRFPVGHKTADDFYDGTVAAAFGGITTIVNFARQRPGMSLRASIDERIATAGAAAVIDFGFHVLPDTQTEQELAEIPDLVRDGFPSFKVFLNRADDAWTLSLLRAVGRAGGLTVIHCENAAIIGDATAKLERVGMATARHWPLVRPVASELEGVRRAIGFCAYTGSPVYLVHLSAEGSVTAVRTARRNGVPVHAETRPAYLVLTSERYDEPDPRHLMYTGSPPLRDRRSVDALWRGLETRVIDTVASDHAAYTLDQKRVGDHDLANLPVGMPSLETQSAMLYSEGVRTGRISLRRFVDVTAANPARLMGLYPRKGVITKGSDADLVILDPNRTRIVSAQDMHSKAGHEPLEGLTFTGWPVATIARGDVIVRDGTFLGQKGRGQLLRRAPFGPPVSVPDADIRPA